MYYLTYDLLVEWQDYFSSLLKNDNGQAPSDLPQPAAQDLPIHDHSPTLEEILEAICQMKTNKAAGLYCAITPEALQGGGDAMVDIIHCFCAEVDSNLTPPDWWITSVIVPLPKKCDLSLMNNYRGISLLSIAAKVYNKILLNRIRDEVDPILRKNQAGFFPGRSCAQQIHILRRVLEGFRDYLLPLVITFIDFKKSLWFHQQKSHVRSSLALWDSRSCSQCYQCALQKLKKHCDDESADYLGVSINNKLTWNNHCTKVSSKASRTLGMLHRNISSCPTVLKHRLIKLW